jgi:hypothetical protein
MELDCVCFLACGNVLCKACFAKNEFHKCVFCRTNPPLQSHMLTGACKQREAKALEQSVETCLDCNEQMTWLQSFAHICDYDAMECCVCKLKGILRKDLARHLKNECNMRMVNCLNCKKMHTITKPCDCALKPCFHCLLPISEADMKTHIETHYSICQFCKQDVISLLLEQHQTEECEYRLQHCKHCNTHGRFNMQTWRKHCEFELCKHCYHAQPYCTMTHHLSTSDCRLVECKLCLELVPFGNVDLHTSSVCRKRPITCDVCKQDVISDDFKIHLETACPKWYISCPVVGCCYQKSRKSFDQHHACPLPHSLKLMLKPGAYCDYATQSDIQLVQIRTVSRMKNLVKTQTGSHLSLVDLYPYMQFVRYTFFLGRTITFAQRSIVCGPLKLGYFHFKYASNNEKDRVLKMHFENGLSLIRVLDDSDFKMGQLFHYRHQIFKVVGLCSTGIELEYFNPSRNLATRNENTVASSTTENIGLQDCMDIQGFAGPQGCLGIQGLEGPQGPPGMPPSTKALRDYNQNKRQVSLTFADCFTFLLPCPIFSHE